jgi:hypothetical protein
MSFEDLYQQYFEKHDVRKEKDGAAICMAEFAFSEAASADSSCQRLAAKVLSIHALCFDFDGEVSLNGIKEMFSDKNAIFHTTYSHGAAIIDGGDNDDVLKVKESVRVITPLKSPATPDDIKAKTKALIENFKGLDTSTFDIARPFYLPTCHPDRQEFAESYYQEGDLLDLNDFESIETIAEEPFEAVGIVKSQHTPLPTYVRHLVKHHILSLGKSLKYDEYFRLCAAMVNAGFTLTDWLDVSKAVKSSKSPIEARKQWKYAQTLTEISPQYLVTLLNKHGKNIDIAGAKNISSSKIKLIEKEIDLLDQNIALIHEQEALPDDEKLKLINEKQQQKKEKLQSLDKAKNDAEAKLEGFILDMLNRRDIYYVQDEDMFFEYKKITGEWLKHKTNSLPRSEPFLQAKGANKRLYELLENTGRNLETVSFSPKPTAGFSLNLFRKDHWLQPMVGEHHEVFDILLNSLGDLKEENILHLKQVIAWKYLYPDDYHLPAIAIYGGGGTGKNMLVDILLAAIFGANQVHSEKEDSTKDFNGLYEGMMAVLKDESSFNDVDMEKLKAMLDKAKLNVNPKFGKEKVVYNTALYFIAGNNSSGPIKLCRSKSDRRFSILKASRSIIEHTKLHHNNSHKEAEIWWHQHEYLLGDKDEVAKWLNHILDTVEELPMRPTALHGKDYRDLLIAQAGPEDWLFDHVFNADGFKFISGDDCFELYKLRCEYEALRINYSRNQFITYLKDKLNESHPTLVYGQIKVKFASVAKSRTGWLAKSVETKSLNYENIQYIGKDEHNRSVILELEPELAEF